MNWKKDSESSNCEIIPFVEDWDIIQTLGEGAFGEVKLLVHRKTHDTIAVKILDLSLPECKEITKKEAKKEVCILKMLKHKNIIGFVGHRVEADIHYVFLEYAAGGELFDRIEPDVGMPEIQAQNYFRQLIEGTEFLHSRGVAHRDLKPENLLLTESDILKISDFGMATIFRHKGEERLLNKRCGTLPYVAPEVICREYRAEPADIWSTGIVLVALLAGELPWDSPSSNCRRFADWREGQGWRQKPFSKIDNVALSLLRSVLNCNPDQRATMERIKGHQWFVKDFVRKKLLSRVPSTESQSKSKRFRSNYRLDQPKSDLDDENARVCFSQPETTSSSTLTTTTSASNEFSSWTANCTTPAGCQSGSREWSQDTAKEVNFSFSQPARLDTLLLNTQSQSSQAALNPLQKLVKRMTRFFVTVPIKSALSQIESSCKKFGYSTKRTTAVQLTVFTIDSRRNNLSFKVNVYETNERVLVDFRLSKGDGLDFKRIFVKLREKSKLIIDHREIESWSFAKLIDENQSIRSSSTTPSAVSLSVEKMKLTESCLSIKSKRSI